MAKLFRALRTEWTARDLDQTYWAEKLGRSQAYISRRMTGKEPWTLDEAYIMLDDMGLPPERIVDLFPRKGMYFQPKAAKKPYVLRAAK